MAEGNAVETLSLLLVLQTELFMGHARPWVMGHARPSCTLQAQLYAAGPVVRCRLADN